MKPTLTTYLICITFLFSTLAKAQEMGSTKTSETILKMENPYKKGRTKWLNKNGFNTSTYDWGNPEINLFLDKAVKRRSTANFMGIVGGSVLALGLVANVVGSLAHSISDSRPNEDYQVIKGPYFIGGAMVATSIALSFDSIGKLNKAKAAREKKFK